MNDPQSEHPDDLLAAHEAEFEARQDARRKSEQRLRLSAGSLFLLLILFGPMLFGAGILGLKACNQEDTALWIYNTSDAPTKVNLYVKAPLGGSYNVEVEAQGIARLIVPSGDYQLRWEYDGQQFEEAIAFQTPTILNVGNNTCYAIFDMTSFYRGDLDPDLVLHHRVPAGTHIIPSSSKTLVVPRQAMPRNASGYVHWIEDFECGLLDPENEEALLMRARIKLEQREQELQERDAQR